ncbi:hypothetical protein GKG47_09050 [Lactonifactor sp. BIOML-A3]|uniref:DNA polymerase III subunit beta n=1 Tax=unclassified Lactonifactor TaxID=2636670 RepID=UPI0012B1221D|nr:MULTISPECIES: DNA polymerase III subunit beta [unclassified Lactonifactor]MSA02185.1 hypothetical protein [Lactonifactor sp. BIOML-A5]MSA07970.1 hypothetical protein [Lactonifactor sp. BIOML-A4]MSA12586.1 hypothetical protein [Lactonifactor sp. BIOML-A3]MSA16713.1 hypothetical protein [Lactonifactor sp. BIOML-A2]MSA37588.1 hypothetical protein [Lactonifactor sp. BIOML-A1]
MKINIDMKDFKEMTEKVLPSVVKKSSVPILETVLLYTEHGKLNMVATDFETELRVFQHANIISDGKCCIHHDDIKQIIKLKADAITLEYDEEAHKIIVNTDKKTVTNTNNQGTEDFPRFVYSMVQAAYTTSGNNLLETLEKLSYYISKDDVNKLMNCYCLDLKKNRIAALDGHRIGVKHIREGINTENEATEILLHSSVYPKLKKCLKTDNNVTISTCESDIKSGLTVISGIGFEMATRNVEGVYFKLDNMLMNKYDLKMCKLNTKELMEVSKYNVDLLKDGKKPMVFYNNNGSMVSYAIGTKGESMDILETEENNTEADFTIAFNPTFLVELCRTIDTDVLEVGFTNPKAPMMVYGKEYDFLILPVNIRDNNIVNNIKKLLEKAA